MKKSNFYLLLVFVQCIAFSSLSTIAIAQNITPSTWQNQSGSYLVIQSVSAEGQLTGYYINNNSSFSCIGTPYPLTGWALPGTNTITFTVQWLNSHANCQSLTSWTGYTNTGNSTMTTRWILVANGGSFYDGNDTFSRVGQQINTSLVKHTTNSKIKKKEKH